MEFNLEHYVTSMLDIGANQGVFSKSFKDRNGVKNIVCLEPNPHHATSLKDAGFETYSVGASDINGKKTFYINSDSIHSTGNSFYLEQTVHFKNVTEMSIAGIS